MLLKSKNMSPFYSLSNEIHGSLWMPDTSIIQYNLKSLFWLVFAIGAFVAQIVTALAAHETLPVVGIIIPSMALCLFYLLHRQKNVIIAYCLIVLCVAAISLYVNPSMSLLLAVPSGCFFANMLTFPASISSLVYARLVSEASHQVDASRRQRRRKLGYWLIGLGPFAVAFTYIAVKVWMNDVASRYPVPNQGAMFVGFVVLAAAVILSLFCILIGIITLRINRR